jgi:Family of unknown function (DUF5994)
VNFAPRTSPDDQIFEDQSFQVRLSPPLWSAIPAIGCAGVPTELSPVTRSVGSRGRANSIRLSVAPELGRDIDGAWWPHVDRITNELPHLVTVLTPLLGDITSINVNWPPLQRPPDLNWSGWEDKRQHVMTVSGGDARVNLLVISYSTYTALAVMLLNCAASLPVTAADRDQRAFATAGLILRAALRQRASSCH